VLDRIAAELMEHETLETERVQELFSDVRMFESPAADGARVARRPDGARPAPGPRPAAAATPADGGRRQSQPPPHPSPKQPGGAA
jgi:hypothetical protein